MMKIRLCAVGKLRNGPELEIFNRYRLRFENIGKSINMFPLEVNQFDDVTWKRNLNEKKWKTAFSEKNYKILLDENGAHISSKNLASKLIQNRDEGYGETIFFIGGAEGIPEIFKDRFNSKICFGSMVWPHLMVRLMLMEQIYRAGTIIAGLPYHKD